MMGDLDGALALSNIVIARLQNPDARLRDVYHALRINQTELNEWCKATFDNNSSRIIDSLRFGARVGIPNVRVFYGFLEVDPEAVNRHINPTCHESGSVTVKDNTALVCTNGDIFIHVTTDTFNSYHDLWIKNGSALCTTTEGKFSKQLYANSRVEDNAVVDAILAMTTYRVREIGRDKRNLKK